VDAKAHRRISAEILSRGIPLLLNLTARLRSSLSARTGKCARDRLGNPMFEFNVTCAKYRRKFFAEAAGEYGAVNHCKVRGQM